MGELKTFPLKTQGAEDPKRILQHVIDQCQDLQGVVIVGQFTNGRIETSSSCGTNIESLGLLDLGRHNICLDSEE